MAELRRSSRLKSTSQTHNEDSQDEKENTMKSAVPRPPAKRQKRATRTTSGPTPRRGQGKLRMLPEMPLDILFEIFGHLLPLDLLRLAWTTKSLRRILMRRSARSVWIHTLANVPGLPECPPDLTEPQFSRLAFDPHCHYCGAPNIWNIAWVLRVRVCVKCQKKRFVYAYSGLWSLPVKVIGEAAYYLKGIVATRKGKNEMIFPTEDVDDFLKQAVPLLGDQEAFDQFLAQRKAICEPEYEFAERCYEWMEKTRADEIRRESEIQLGRKQAIAAELYGLGYGADVFYLLHYQPLVFLEHPLVNKSQALTNRIWNNIKEPLIQLMQETRVERLRFERMKVLMKREKLVKKLLEDFAMTRPTDEALPGPADVCQMVPFKEIIERPVEEKIKKRHFRSAVAELPRLCQEWRDRINGKLLSMVPVVARPGGDNHSSSDVQEDHSTEAFSRLDLATTYFRCTKCDSSITYPRILHHACMTELDYAGKNYNPDDEDAYALCRRAIQLGHEPWDYDGRQVSFDVEASEVARRFVETCGRDPDTTTRKHMDDTNSRFRCTGYKPGGSNSDLVMTWQVAISHEMIYREIERPLTWTCLDESQIALAKSTELVTDPRNLVRQLACTWTCCQCPHSRYNWSALQTHLFASHDVFLGVEGSDYVIHPDTPPMFHSLPMQFLATSGNLAITELQVPV
ncbi:hypothetical protein JAAARDRAFT_148747 [Jaapia argillacea MUCL 33604]|uniref:F-box domain-containing protein n=1 Tax=Jaapia argillacea MUCL 33604 TaxID=933084 RepID=A0A067QF07_9AGAM|nr:hypothetical protein JAAARDRAFT_148747 [Jaapia argillacea MUCL 33604]